jgi:hypothetical protein
LRRVDCADDAVLELQDNQNGVQVTGFANLRIHPHAPGGLDSNPTAFRDLSGRVGIDVGDHHGRSLRQAEGSSLRMHPANPAGADDSDSEFLVRQARVLEGHLHKTLFDRA